MAVKIISLLSIGWFVEILLLGSICIIAILYASVGHGGASGYLAVLSLTTYATQDTVWLKQHVWSLNLIVAGIASVSYTHLTLPTILRV